MKQKINALLIFTQVHFEVIAWVLFIFMIFFRALTCSFTTFDQDELEAIHTAWKISKGSMVYRDFFQHHHPLLYYCLIPLINFFGQTLKTLVAARVLMHINYLLCGIVTYLIASHIFNRTSALLSIFLLLFSSIFSKVIEIRPDGPQVLFGLLAVYFLFLYFDRKHLLLLFFSALSLAISFLFLQKILFLIVLIGLVFLYKIYQKQISLLALIFYISIFCIALIPYYSYLVYTNALHYYFIFNWLFNIMHPERFYPMHTLMELFLNKLLLFGYALGLIYYLHTQNQKIVAFFSLSLLFIAIFIVKFSFPQYYAPAIPFIAMIAAYGYYVIFDGQKDKILLMIFIIAAQPFISYSFILAKMIIKGKNNNEQHEKINYVLSHTKPGDTIYDGKNIFNIFRDDIDFMWFQIKQNHDKSSITDLYKSLTGKSYDIYQAIENKKPKIISNYYLDMEHPIIKNNYKKSLKYNDLYIRKN
ncbi:MAG: glycosyltransferase family 39 protein [Candidatus Babeliales bacterium]